MTKNVDYKEDFEHRRDAVIAAALEGEPFPSFEEEIPEDELEELKDLYRRTCEEFNTSSERPGRIDAVSAAVHAGLPFPSFKGEEVSKDKLIELKAYYDLAREELLAKETGRQPGDNPAPTVHRREHCLSVSSSAAGAASRLHLLVDLLHLLRHPASRRARTLRVLGEVTKVTHRRCGSSAAAS